MNEIERKLRRRISSAKYKKTAKGKAAEYRYRHSPRGKEKSKLSISKWAHSSKGRISQAKSRNRPNALMCKLRFYQRFYEKHHKDYVKP